MSVVGGYGKGTGCVASKVYTRPTLQTHKTHRRTHVAPYMPHPVIHRKHRYRHAHERGARGDGDDRNQTTDERRSSHPSINSEAIPRRWHKYNGTDTDMHTHVAPKATGRSKSRVAPSQSGVHVCFLLGVMVRVVGWVCFRVVVVVEARRDDVWWIRGPWIWSRIVMDGLLLSMYPSRQSNTPSIQHNAKQRTYRSERLRAPEKILLEPSAFSAQSV